MLILSIPPAEMMRKHKSRFWFVNLKIRNPMLIPRARVACTMVTRASRHSYILQLLAMFSGMHTNMRMYAQAVNFGKEFCISNLFEPTAHTP